MMLFFESALLVAEVPFFSLAKKRVTVYSVWHSYRSFAEAALPCDRYALFCKLQRLVMRAQIMGEEEDLPERAEFTTTHWNVVLAARDLAPAQAQAALETLCRSYWYPLYACVRRLGHSPDDAQDLTQSFFAHLLGKEFLRNVAQDKGRFRSFLLACLKRFLVSEWRKERTWKRGGGRFVPSLDEREAEIFYLREPVDLEDAEKLYERRWALTLLDRVLDRLEGEFAAAGKSAMFSRLQPFLMGEKGAESYAGIAADWALSESAVKMTVLRMRERYRALFREEIARTVSSPAEVDEEIRCLFAIVGNASHATTLRSGKRGTHSLTE